MAESLHNTDSFKKLQELIYTNKEINLLDLEYDDFLRFATPYNSYNKALGTSLYGINHRGVRTLTVHDKDQQGYVFFTRPQLNLIDDNLRKSRHFFNLMVDDRNSIFRYVRNLLDPRLGSRKDKDYNSGGETFVTGAGAANIPEYLDNNNAFIVPFTNYITSCTGWPEPIVPTYASKEGVNGEQYMQVDGRMDINNVYDISCTFRNPKESPILFISYYWALYSTLVFDGTFLPEHDMLAANEIDYNTRIYRIITDETKTKVKYISATGASMITAPNIASIFNYNEGNPYLDQNRELTINFKSAGATYQDPILIDEFNKTVGIFNPDMMIIRREKLLGKISGQTNYVKIPHSLLTQMNFRGYPMIDYETNELEWFVDRNTESLEGIRELAKKGLRS